MTTAAASSTIMVPQGRGGVMASFAPGAGTTPAFNKGDSPSFSDLVDIVNPLQHIPVINTVYRALTGDHESAFADVVGGALYGGPLGAGLAVADLGLRDATGKTAGEHAMAWLGIGDKGDAPKASDTAVAAASQPAAQVAAATQAKTLTAVPPLKTAGSQAGNASKTAAKAAASSDTAANTSTGPTLAPANLMASDAVQPAAKMATIKPAVSPYAAPVAEAPAESGPVTAGDYLVFGGPSTAGQSASAAPQAAAPVAAATSATGKTFATIGANATPAATLPDVVADTQSGTPVAAQPVAAMAAPSSNQMASAADKPHMFRVPPRNGPAAPPATLPPPTTGPGALPGGKSLALTAQEAAVQQDPQHNFLTAYTQALDKYRNAQRLAGQNPTASANGDAPANLLQPASAIAPIDAGSDTGSALTLH